MAQLSHCKVSGCNGNHQKHYCRLCQNNDANHRSSLCPTGIDLYHGTRVSNISGICREGLKASTGGRLGPGVYLTTLNEAQKIAAHRGQGTGTAIFKVHVNLGKTHDNKKADDNAGSWATKGFDSCKGIHPPWSNNLEFMEWCLKDPKRLRITDLILIDGTVDGDIHLPRCTISIQGTCRFKGKVTAGTVLIDGNLTIG